MKFGDLQTGQSIVVDANPLVDYFSAHPKTGIACRVLMERIVRQELNAFTTTHIVAEMAHRLMTIEACAVFGWPYKGIAQRLASHPAEVQQLGGFRRAIEAIPNLGIQVLPVLPIHLTLATDLIGQHGLLYNDSLLVAVMQSQGIPSLASNDADFDRVPNVFRYSPE